MTSTDVDVLLETLNLSESAINSARSLSARSGFGLLRALNQMGHLSDSDICEIYQQITGFDLWSIDDFPVAPAVCDLTLPFIRAKQILPIERDDGVIDIAFTDPTDIDALNGVKFALEDRIGRRLIASPSDWKKAFSGLYEIQTSLDGLSSSSQDQILDQILDQDRDAPVARRLAGILSDAVQLGASDVHIETRRNGVDVRFRRDGELTLVAQESAEAASALIARIKVIADLDLGERRLPQDGRSTIVVEGRQIDVRVSIVPTAVGESAVLRLLDRPDNLLTLTGLGFSQRHCSELENLIRAKDGLILFAGPTGSGKTTSLYACLQLLRTSNLKIVSVEDPIEYQFEHVTQVQANETSGFTFPVALRSFLRHDPDVISVGEIRDRETAQIAVQAALTGHLVVASVHAIDADRIDARLIDMGVDRLQLEAALRTGISQRLVRRLCSECHSKSPPSLEETALFERVGLRAPRLLPRSEGCENCMNSGFSGRIVIAEIIGEDADALLRDGLEKAGVGLTTVKEIIAIAKK
ncbi:MAG: GspE/PulE family protein [Pseudomonadota bacterium]